MNLFKKSHNFVFLFLLLASTLIMIEFAGQVTYRIKTGNWLFLVNEFSCNSLFMGHPYLVGVPTPNIRITKNNITISHNSQGFRGHEINFIKNEDIKRVVVLGGSTTYCVGVSDEDTWPQYLEQYLGQNSEVINLGVPGYTTVENLIQTAFLLSDLSPNIAIYYEGFNDMRNCNIKGLKSDYSDYHGKTQYYNLRLNASIFDGFFIFEKFRNFWVKITRSLEPTEDAFSAKPDNRVLDLYARNLYSIISLCKKLNIIPIFVPQILKNNGLVNENKSSWMPYMKEKDITLVINSFNEKMRQVAHNENVYFVEGELNTNFKSMDFLDNCHFSPTGNKEFAKIIGKFMYSNNILNNN